MSCAHLQLWYNKTKDAWTICAPLYIISSVIIGRKQEYEWKVDSNQLFFNFLSISTQLWASLININSYQLNCEMLLSISMSTSIVPILAYQLLLINALNISATFPLCLNFLSGEPFCPDSQKTLIFRGKMQFSKIITLSKLLSYCMVLALN